MVFIFFEGVLEIVYGLLLESLVLGLLALIASLVASFHKKATLVTAVVAMEIVSGMLICNVIFRPTFHPLQSMTKDVDSSNQNIF